MYDWLLIFLHFFEKRHTKLDLYLMIQSMKFINSIPKPWCFWVKRLKLLKIHFGCYHAFLCIIGYSNLGKYVLNVLLKIFCPGLSQWNWTFWSILSTKALFCRKKLMWWGKMDLIFRISAKNSPETCAHSLVTFWSKKMSIGVIKSKISRRVIFRDFLANRKRY